VNNFIPSKPIRKVQLLLCRPVISTMDSVQHSCDERIARTNRALRGQYLGRSRRQRLCTQRLSYFQQPLEDFAPKKSHSCCRSPKPRRPVRPKCNTGAICHQVSNRLQSIYYHCYTYALGAAPALPRTQSSALLYPWPYFQLPSLPIRNLVSRSPTSAQLLE